MAGNGSVTVRVRLRWWVHPFMAAAVLAAIPFVAFMDDDQASHYSARIAEIIAAHGFKLEVI